MSKHQYKPGIRSIGSKNNHTLSTAMKKLFLYGVPVLASVLVIAVIAVSFFSNQNPLGVRFGKIDKKNIDVVEEIAPIEKLEEPVVEEVERINRDLSSSGLKELSEKALSETKTLSLADIQSKANVEEPEPAEIKIEEESSFESEKADLSDEIITKPDNRNKPVDNPSVIETPVPTEETVPVIPADQQDGESDAEVIEPVEEPTQEPDEEPAQEPDEEPAQEPDEDYEETWVDKYVNAEILNIRYTPSFSGEVIGSLQQGDLITEISTNYEWWSEVLLSDGSSGYVYNYYLTSEYVAPMEEPEPVEEVEESSFTEMSGTFYIAVGAANMRAAATTDAELVDTLYYGMSIDYIGYAEGWYKVVNASGNVGYIREDLLQSDPVPQEEIDALNEVSEDTIAEEYAEETPDPVAPEPVEEPEPVEPVAPGNSGGVAAANIAASQVGKPYVYATAGPNSFDCSGLVQYAIRNAGGSISRSSYSQAYDGIAVPFSSGDYSQLAPGDVLCFAFGGGGVSHTGMYLGNGQFVHAMNPSDGIQINSIYDWANSLAYVRRIFY